MPWLHVPMQGLTGSLMSTMCIRLKMCSEYIRWSFLHCSTRRYGHHMKDNVSFPIPTCDDQWRADLFPQGFEMRWMTSSLVQKSDAVFAGNQGIPGDIVPMLLALRIVAIPCIVCAFIFSFIFSSIGQSWDPTVSSTEADLLPPTGGDSQNHSVEVQVLGVVRHERLRAVEIPWQMRLRSWMLVLIPGINLRWILDGEERKRGRKRRRRGEGAAPSPFSPSCHCHGAIVVADEERWLTSGRFAGLEPQSWRRGVGERELAVKRETHEELKPTTSLVTVSAMGYCRQPRELPPCRRYCAVAPPFNLIPPCLYRRYCSEVFAVDSDFVLFRLKPLLPLVARKPPLLLLPRPCFVRNKRLLFGVDVAGVTTAGSNAIAAVAVAVGPSEFLAAVEAAAGSARDCGCSILLLLIELSGLPVAIKTVSAIAEVSRPTIEAAVYSGGEE
ncbi:hypothetical protein AHAS_Ahas13G0424100 [Arachis hypogaea]